VDLFLEHIVPLISFGLVQLGFDWSTERVIISGISVRGQIVRMFSLECCPQNIQAPLMRNIMKYHQDQTAETALRMS
jgi:hypothetical protein